MILLVLGVLLFASVHFVPTFAPALKTGLIQRLGEGPYKGIFSLLLLLSFALMIFGWRSTTPVLVYSPPLLLHKFALGLLAVAFLLLVVSSRKSRLRRLIRHPQLTGVALWGFSHLLLNGDTRSLVLFAGMALWALLEIVAISRRDGVWIKTDVPSWGTEAVTVLIAAVTVAVVITIHPWLSGVAVW
ncbi:MAG: NnrU family protein [Halioglobus sp.]